MVVWIHGGGLKSGAGNDMDARRLAVGGKVVVVTINYRLGVFGFFGYPGLAGSGTFALSDQQAALPWVRRNIARFGGDAHNVTVMGESAGGDSICARLTSPAASGLFGKAIIQSGSCGDVNSVDVLTPGIGELANTWRPVSTVRAQGAQVAAALGCPFDLPGRQVGFTPDQQLLSQRMIGYVAGFAAVGDPNRDGLPYWPPVTGHRSPVTGSSPTIQRLAPGPHGVGPTSTAAFHRCGMWSELD